MAYNPYTGEDDTQLNMFGSPITNVGTDFNNQMAYVPGSDKDKFLKNLYEMKSTYGETGAYKQNLQKDWDNYKKTGDPLSLPKQEYSGVKGFASLEDEPYDFSGITRHTAMGDNIMRDFNYDVDPATISGPDYLAQFKRGIPENWLQQKKGITGADASKYIARKPIDGTDIDMQYTTGDEFNIPPRKKGFQFPSFLREGLGAIRDKLRPSPEEQFGASYFPQTDTGRVYQDPNQSLYGGMNVDTMWGEGIGGAGQKRIDRLQKTIDNYQKQWGHLDQDEYDMKLKRRQDQLKEFKTQQTAYSNALAAQNIQTQKDKAAADAIAQQRAQDRAAGAFSSQVRQDPGGGGTWQRQTRAKERQGEQVAGPGFGKGAYFTQGGRVGYKTGGRVGILSVF